MKILIPSVYFGPISFYQLLNSADEIKIEIFENYRKQTYRNRCEIYGANGKLDLIVPIKHGRCERTIMKNALIDYSSRWQQLHWRSIESGYRRSPYFEYYEDKIKVLFESKYESLVELNAAILEFTLKVISVSKNINYTSSYEESYIDFEDYRNQFDPRIPSKIKTPVYTQVFEPRYGFISNLSFLDLLFNEGPSAITRLK